MNDAHRARGCFADAPRTPSRHCLSQQIIAGSDFTLPTDDPQLQR
jgi:hypothetical protein